MKLEVVPRFQINGKKYTYDELSKEKIMEIIQERIDDAMARLQFERTGKKTYENAFEFGKAVGITVTPSYAEGSLYADDGQAEHDKEFSFADVSLNTSTIPVDEHATRGENIEYKTPSITGRASADEDGDWKEFEICETEDAALKWIYGKFATEEQATEQSEEE